jgi:chromosome segregation ATPase
VKRLAAFALVTLALGPGARAEEPPAPPARPAAPSEAESNDAAWAARLAEAKARLVAARGNVAESEAALSRARHRRQPRGEALDDLESALAEARDELAAASEELPELLEQARRDGVSPGVLREFEPDDEEADEALEDEPEDEG